MHRCVLPSPFSPSLARSSTSADSLSAGERQKLGIARLLLWADRKRAAGQPLLALLDEALSNVDADTVAALFAPDGAILTRCAAGMALVTISHRPLLRQYHTTLVAIEGSTSGGRVDVTEL